ncbi:MAG TPA: hypothetical protein VJI52_03875 [Candidatus Nanoarchaeia archaeon]|nr:hypothetical protein [Candidatus Nanoarchaeia archaeon]
MARGGSSKSGSVSTPSYVNKPGLHEKPVFHYAVILLVAVALVVSILALVNTYQLKSAIIPKTISPEQFLKKLTAHPEMRPYIGTPPLNIIQINGNNLANLQSQINGLDSTFIGSFIIQYTDGIVLYDYDNDKIKGVVSLDQPQQANLPADFFTKLNKHAELQGLQGEQPIGGQLDQKSLDTLSQQFPDVYKDAKVGDFLLRYKTRLVIYDYPADKIVNAVNLQ